ncbi:hypothetical protein OWR29_34075 [Actinoplanes sp. Pm04-4]|uniref:DUF4367 domain-containing protein n=1 Tax=Paractinoplanes pyxinae TaxID=2997416 RepID=A0ABT4BB63_9ACTN|nr:hypothetical protein [Actinoplanes pyxinae]MCY1143050.1 hypothetical protein [Actinoplanes pyxinae]
MTIEDDLRVTLQQHAARPASSPDPDLWESVAAGVWRRRRRQRAATVGAAAVALAAVAALPPLLSQRDQRTPEPPAVTPTVEWVHPSWSKPDFPLRPSWVPADAGERTVSRLGPNSHLSYERGTSVLSAEVGPLQADWEVEATDVHETTVNGRPASVHASGSFDGAAAGERYVGVRWQLADKRWVQVLSFGKRTEADVLRFARGLTSGSVNAGLPPFVFDVIPPSYTLQHQSADLMCLAPTADVAKERQPTGICIHLGGPGEDDDAGAPGERTTVNGNPAIYFSGTGVLNVELPGDRTLRVEWQPDEPTSPTSDEILRLATSIHVQP